MEDIERMFRIRELECIFDDDTNRKCSEMDLSGWNEKGKSIGTRTWKKMRDAYASGKKDRKDRRSIGDIASELAGMEIEKDLDDAVGNVMDAFGEEAPAFLSYMAKVCSVHGIRGDIIDAMKEGDSDAVKERIRKTVDGAHSAAVVRSETAKPLNGWIRKAWCLFEQSGTFRRSFSKNGVEAVDADIQDNFLEVGIGDDLFAAIDDALAGRPSLFDGIGEDDITLAFFPCIYFCACSQMMLSPNDYNYRRKSEDEVKRLIAERYAKRAEYERLFRGLLEIYDRGGHGALLIENPWSMQTYLKELVRDGVIGEPFVIDGNRSRHGDRLMKPTAFFHAGRHLDKGEFAEIRTPKEKVVRVYGLKHASRAGLCSEDRSMIEQVYADNFVSNVIFGRKEPFGGTFQEEMFDGGSRKRKGPASKTVRKT